MWWLLIATFGTYIGNGMHYTALSWLTLESPAGVAGLGILGLTMYVPYLVMAKPGAVFSRSRMVVRILIGTEFLRAVIVFLGYFAFLFYGPSSITAWCMTFCLNSLSAIFLPAYFTSVAIKFQATPSKIVRFNSLSVTMVQGGDILGSLGAAWLLQHVSPPHLLLVDALSYILSGILMTIAFYDLVKAPLDIEARNGQAQATTRESSRSPFTRTTISVSLMGAITATVVTWFNLLMPIVSRRLTGAPSLFALMSACYAIGAATGGTLLSQPKWSREKIGRFLPLTLLTAALFSLLLLSNTPTLAVVVCLLLGLANGGIGGVLRSIPQICFDADMIGQVTSQRVVIETILALGLASVMILLPYPVNTGSLSITVPIMLVLLTMVMFPLPNMLRLMRQNA
ncbi:MAG TPA: MFS transporter [Ktedonobacteraceae bacterium]|jgi:DHA3 family macrolide efflux protein-like MFS transporter|nr:MFS transporter [Ktedonobacteraceae bacterium]